MGRGGARWGAGDGACLTKRSALSLRGSGSSASAMTATTAVRTSTLSCHRCAASKAASRDGGAAAAAASDSAGARELISVSSAW